jgi:hypothetical protein
MLCVQVGEAQAAVSQASKHLQDVKLLEEQLTDQRQHLLQQLENFKCKGEACSKQVRVVNSGKYSHELQREMLINQILTL